MKKERKIMNIIQADMFSFGDKARESILNYDVEGLLPNLDSTDIIGAILGEGADALTCMQLKEVPLRQLMNYSIDDFRREGLNECESIKLHASFLLTKKVISEKDERKNIIGSPEDLYDELKYLEYENQENFVVLYLNTKNQVIKRQVIFVGSLNASIVHPREVFREAIKLSSASIAVAHNHPSGDSSPSQEDLLVTKRLVEAGKVVGCEVLDHIIIGRNNFISLKEKGYI